METIAIKEKAFYNYLKSNLSENAYNFLDELKSVSNFLVFSGIIRNFYLNYSDSLRDLDLVITNNFDKVVSIIENNNCIYDYNSFGGIKLYIDNFQIDIWDIKNTWALKENKVERTIFSEFDLMETCFFNFSSVLYDYNQRKLYKSKMFNDFVKTKMLDIVLEDNPLPELCVVNTFYYQQKYNLEISDKLKKYLKKTFKSLPQQALVTIQEKHFNRIVFSYPCLKDKLKDL